MNSAGIFRSFCLKDAFRFLLIPRVKGPPARWLKRCSACDWDMMPLDLRDWKCCYVLCTGVLIPQRIVGLNSIQLLWLRFFVLKYQIVFLHSHLISPWSSSFTSLAHLKLALLLHFKRLINQSIKKFFAVKLNQERSCRREKNRLN